MSHRSSYNPSMDKHWDPMQEAYRDPNFNSYKDGPGAKLDLDKQPCSLGTSKEKTTFKLFVGNVPSDLGKEGVENAFRTVGNPIEVAKHNSNNYAFVTFRTFREAEEARRKLDRRPPMNFKIDYARSHDDTEKKRQINNFEFPQEAESRGVRRSVENMTPSGKGRGLAVAPYQDPRAQKPGTGQDTSDIGQFQQYGGSNYDESNTAIMKGVQRDNGPGGPKKFVNGRGCFDREMDQLLKPKKLDDVIDNLHQTNKTVDHFYQGPFEYSKKEYPPNWLQGTCTYCKEPSTQFCGVCKDWYCSRSCQEKDWPRHRAYCGNSKNHKEVPDATKQISSPQKSECPGGKDDSYQQNNGYTPESKDSLTSDSRYTKRKDYDYAKKRGADTDAKQGYSQKNDSALQKKCTKKGSSSCNVSDEFECAFEKNENSSYKTHSPTDAKEPKFKKKGLQNRFSNGRDKSDYEKEESFVKGKYNDNAYSEKFHDKNLSVNDNSKRDNIYSSKPKSSLPNVQKGSKSNDTKERPNEKTLEIFEENERLSDSSFTEVSVQIVLNSDEYWVVLTSNLQEILSMSSAMEELTERAPVVLGKYCMAKYEQMWFRARITSVQPKLTVFFIDFGNEETVTPEEIRMLPDKVKNMKAQAIRIKLAPQTSEKYHMMQENSTLCVKRVYENEKGICIVHVKGEVYEQSAVSHSIEEVQSNVEEQPIAMQSVTVLLKNDMKCKLFVMEYNNTEFLACLLPSNMIDHYNYLFSSEFQVKCESFQMINVPKAGEAVLAKFSEDGWLRSYVLHVSSKKEFTVASCDLGIVETVKEIKKMPPNCREIVQFAVQCIVLDEDKSLDLSSFCADVTIESVSADKALAVLDVDSGEQCKIEIKKWDAPYELYEELKCVELKNGDCVISAEMSPFELYIRPLSEACIDIYNRLLQDVAKHCFKSPPLKYSPKLGQVLAARFTEDGNFYRAVVRDVNKTKGVKVQYIDFGNVEYVSQDALKPLNKTLRSIECSVVKVILEGVVDRPLNEEVQKLFKELILQPATLKIKLSDPRSNKVRLYYKDGTDLNEKINKMLIPGWKKGVVDQQIYTIDDVVIEKLEFDTPVELVILSVLSFPGKENEIIVRPQRSKVIQTLQNDLQDMIDEYCENSQEPYTPREMELCVAKVENTWCRCLCLSGGNPLSLYLLDDGRVRDVTHDNIRKYLQEFTTLPAVGVRCRIKTSVNHSKKEEISGAIRHYLKTMKVVTAKVIQFLPKDANLRGYIIAVPELDEVLKTL